MPEPTNIPDVETLTALIKELAAYVAGQSPWIDDATALDAAGIDSLRLAGIVFGIERCFGVQVPPSEFGPHLRTIGRLSHALGTFVHGVLTTRVLPQRSSAGSQRLLLVDGAGVAELEQAVARRGWRAVMLTYYDLSQAAAPRVGAHGVIDQVEAVDWARPLDVVRRIVDLYASGRIERVAPLDEFGLLPAALATAQLGIPGPSVRAVRNTRDKLHMRRTLEQAGLGQVRYAACRDIAEAQAFLERVGGPIVLKPVSGTGSDGVSLVANSAELIPAFALAAGATGFTGILCEEYIDGPEVSLEGYSVDGRFVPVALTDKLIDEHFLEIGHQQPSSQPQSLFEAAAEIAERALAALGVRDGVTHTEFKIARQGPVLIETHTRMGGDCIHVLTRLTTGVDLVDMAVAFSLGETVEALPKAQGCGAAIRFILGRPGRVSGVTMPAVEDGSGIHAVMGPSIGKVVSGRSVSGERLGHVIATGPTAEIAGRIAEEFIAKIRIDYFEQSDHGAMAPTASGARSDRGSARAAAPSAS